MNLNKLAKEIYQQNKNVGWWDDPNRCVFECLQLVSTEFAEASEGARCNKMDTHLEHRKMEEVEFADSLMRLLDFGGRHKLIYTEVIVDHYFTQYEKVFQRPLSNLGNHFVCNIELTSFGRVFAFVGGDAANAQYSISIECILYIADKYKYNVLAALMEKMEFNKTRPDHTRENRAKEHGKKC
jgi:hypothetical protein